jgi:phosphonate transport system permease protein
MNTYSESLQLNVGEIKIKKTKLGRYKLKKRDSKDKLVMVVIAAMFFSLIYYLGFEVDYKWDMFSPHIAKKIVMDFFRFDLVPADEKLGMLSRLTNTVLLGLLTTLLGAAVSFPLGLLAANNISSNKISTFVNAIVSFLRAVPTIVWVLIFVAGYGLSATTAIVGMTFHTIAFFVKSFSESFEEVDPGAIEALKASGASMPQIIFGAIVPSAYTKLISWIAMRTEINFAVAVVIGPAVGVPGTIGTAINVYSGHANYSAMGFGVMCVFLIALAFELIITRIKQTQII